MVSIHQQQKNILCKMLAQPQKQWSLSTRPPKRTKKKKDMRLGSVDRQLMEPRLGKS